MCNVHTSNSTYLFILITANLSIIQQIALQSIWAQKILISAALVQSVCRTISKCCECESIIIVQKPHALDGTTFLIYLEM